MKNITVSKEVCSWKNIQLRINAAVIHCGAVIEASISRIRLNIPYLWTDAESPTSSGFCYLAELRVVSLPPTSLTPNLVFAVASRIVLDDVVVDRYRATVFCGLLTVDGRLLDIHGRGRLHINGCGSRLHVDGAATLTQGVANDATNDKRGDQVTTAAVITTTAAISERRGTSDKTGYCKGDELGFHDLCYLSLRVV